MQDRRRRAVLIVGALVASVVGISVGSSFGNVPAASAAPLGAGGEYHPLTPTRIYDTRAPGIPAGTPGPTQTSAAGVPTDVTVLGQGGIPAQAANVLAVAVSITVISPTREGYLQVYPTGADAGTSSVLNFVAGQNVPNLSILTVGTGGKLTYKVVTPTNGTADVIVDVFGWFSTSNYTTAGARMVPVSPGRIYDSREPSWNPSAQPLGLKQLISIPIRGADAQNPAVTDIVPNSPDVVGVVLNVTGINDNAGSTNTFVSVLPEDPTGAVTTSNLNLAPNQIKANLVIVPVTNADGNIRIYNNNGATHIAVDVVGYMRKGADPATRLGRVIPLTSPFRAFDTREATFGNAALGPTTSEPWSFKDFVNSVTLAGQPVGNQIALIGNLTGTDLRRAVSTVPVQTFMTMYPTDAASRPLSSNINVVEGANVPNMVVVKLSADDSITAYNHAGNIHYLLDISAVVLDNE
jgi:CBS domain-containing protein